MLLQNDSYVPTLAVRASEMNGLEYLPGATKDKLTPCFLLAPWANSNSLERTIDRIERAYPNRNYLLDIDRDYQITNLESVPQQHLVRLRDNANAFRNWVDFVGEHDKVWPCIQSFGLDEEQIRRQIRMFQGMGRFYCMRIVRHRFPENLAEIVGAFAAEGAADFAIVLEGGWTTDPLSLGAWFNGVISESLKRIDADVPIVISCTSIPRMFTEIEGVEPTRFENRVLVDQVRRLTNRSRVIYGDWGSTRPRDRNEFARRPLSRVDYPTEDAWYIARSKEENWDYREAAKAIVERSGVWSGSLGVWGEEMIQQTTIGASLGVNTPQKNVAARVNIHLHLQAFFGQPGPDLSDFEEEWED